MNHRFFEIGGITIRLNAEIDLNQIEFSPALSIFEVSNPYNSSIWLNHYFNLPKLNDYDLGSLIYKKKPWAVYQNKQEAKIYYQGILSDDDIQICGASQNLLMIIQMAKSILRKLLKIE